MNLTSVVDDITAALENEPAQAPVFGRTGSYISSAEKIILEKSKSLSLNTQNRVYAEFSDLGPLQPVFSDDSVIEILICSRESIWIETLTSFYELDDGFLSELTFNNFVERMCAEAHILTNLERPCADGVWRGFRVHIVTPPVAPYPIITLRRVRPRALTLRDLRLQSWCTSVDEERLEHIVQKKSNLLVVGTTGSGKTTVLNSLLSLAKGDRCIFIEDTSELIPPNSLSVKLLTRSDAHGILPEITQSELVKQSLRMRPDRIIMGEVRGAEAKDLLLALSTGHRGSMSTIHAASPREALIRLEMLVQMGAPHWSLHTIRNLIQWTIDFVVVVRKESTRWDLEGIYKISSQEQFGFIIEKTN